MTPLALFFSLIPFSAIQDSPISRADWAFPTIDLSVGERLPNFALPTTAGREPVHLYDLLAERKTVLHIFASW